MNLFWGLITVILLTSCRPLSRLKTSFLNRLKAFRTRYSIFIYHFLPLLVTQLIHFDEFYTFYFISEYYYPKRIS